MKQLIIFLTTFAVTFGYPIVKTWPLNELHETFNKLPEGDPLRPYLEEGAGMILGSIFTGKTGVFGHAVIPSPTGARSWTKIELSRVTDDTGASPILRIVTKRALDNIKKENSAIVAMPAVDISSWTSSDVTKFIKDPKTKPALLPYLKKAQREMKEAKGNRKRKVTLVTPVNLVPMKSGTNHYPMGYLFQKMALGT